MFLSSNRADVIEQRRQGAPVKQIKPSDGVGITQISQWLIKNAPHPNAAKLWIERSLSEEGQNLLAAQGYVAVRNGTRTVEPEASLDRVKFLPATTTWPPSRTRRARQTSSRSRSRRSGVTG
jgi:ABC-type Fe3+ transport system substrate-binding protein